MIKYFPEPKSSIGRVKVELDLSNYAKKADLKNATGVDTSKFARKVDLASLKSEIDIWHIDKLEKVPTASSSLKNEADKLDVDNLKPVPIDLNKWSDVVKNNVVKKDVYNAKIKDIEDKIPDMTNLATNTTLSAKINKVKNEIPSITNLVKTAFLKAKQTRLKTKYLILLAILLIY